MLEQFQMDDLKATGHSQDPEVWQEVLDWIQLT
jgi:hypothetical protein